MSRIVMLMAQLLGFLLGFFRIGITTIKTGPSDPPANLEQDGAMVPNGALVQALAALSANGAPAFGNWSGTVIPNSPAPTMYPGSAMVGGLVMRFSPGAATTDSTDTATNIIAAIPGAKVGQSFLTIVANLGSGLITLGSNIGVQLAGTTQIASATARVMLGKVTGSNTVSITGLFGWNLGTGGTLAAGL